MVSPLPPNSASFSLAEVLSVTGGRVVSPGMAGVGGSVKGVSTDTRQALEGKLFVALSGERFDAHDFLPQAVDAGARALLIERERPAAALLRTATVIRVDSTLAALGALGRRCRERWAGRAVGVAGSAGKTTTRFLISKLLEAALGPESVHSTPGNLNNRIGVPLVLLGLQKQHQLLVVELGTNQIGEVSTLAQIAKPDCGVLTLIDLEHTAGLGTLDQIESEEGAVFGAGCEVAIGNGDDPRVVRQLNSSPSRTRVLYGFSEHCQYRVLRQEPTSDSGSVVRVSTPFGQREFHTALLGAPGILSCLAALATCDAVLPGQLAGLTRATLDLAFAQRPPGGRMTPLYRSDGVLVLDDSYNANPASVRAAIDTALSLARRRGGALHLVLGEMRELGEWSEVEHRKIGQQLAALPFTSLTAIGGDAVHYVPTGKSTARFVQDVSQVLAVLAPSLKSGDTVLVKASRGIRAERVVQELMQQEERALRPSGKGVLD